MYIELETLRLYEMSFSYRDIAKTVGKSKTWVGDFIKDCTKAGIGFEEARVMSRKQLIDHLRDGKTGGKGTGDGNPKAPEAVSGEAASTGCGAPSSPLVVPMAEHPSSSEEGCTEEGSEGEDIWVSYTQMNIGGVKPTRQFLYDNVYSIKQENPLSYSQFCRNYNNALAAGGQKPVMHQEQIPGKNLYIDWAGDTITTTFSLSPDKPKKVYFFLTVLGAGSLPYLEGFESMNQNSWNQGHLNAFAYYGGLPSVLIPDNTKTAVI